MTDEFIYPNHRLIDTMQVAYPIRLLHVYLYMNSRHLINDLNDNKRTKRDVENTRGYMYVHVRMN